MDLGHKLVQQQTQKLIMTPELRQAITVLQLSATELAEFLTEQAQSNPFLEIHEEAARPVAPTLETGRESTREGERFDLDWQEYFHDCSDLGFVPRPERDLDREREGRSVEAYVAEAPTLQDHLRLQLHLSSLGGGDRRIGEYLIGMLDENGYLRTSLEEAARALGVSVPDVERVHRTLTTFDPAGVGARNLAECLRLQLEALSAERRRTAVGELAGQIIEGHLEDLGAGRLTRLASVLGVPAKLVQEAADFIRTLDPKPGRRFATPNDIRYIIPDVIIERVDGDYVVIVNDSAVPRLGINRYYRRLLEDGGTAGTADRAQLGEARAYLESRLNSALWLVRAVEQRRRTLYRVTETIVNLQRDFLDHGLRRLRPMSLKQVAEIIGMHESTISRATSNKYVQTPQGTFELKYLFSSGVAAAGQAGGISSEGVKKHIRDLVAREDPGQPLSDEALARLLGQRGIKISRRTVAKYRDEMGLPPSSRRRRL